MMSTLKIIVVAIFLLVTGTAAGNCFDFSELENSVEEFTLDNGMKFIVLEQHEAPGRL